MNYLADTSAVWRLLRGQVGEPWTRYVARGLVAVCPAVESELMRSVRTVLDVEPFLDVLDGTFGWCPVPEDVWRKTLAVQRDLIRTGHHRGVSPVNIVVALTADEHRLTLLHADTDFDAVAKVLPGLAMIRIDDT